MKLTDKKAEKVAKRASKNFKAKYRMLGNDTFLSFHVEYIVEALEEEGYKVVKREVQ